jgi:hypothetical protein
LGLKTWVGASVFIPCVLGGALRFLINYYSTKKKKEFQM